MVHLSSIPTDEHILSVQEETGSSFFPVNSSDSNLTKNLKLNASEALDKLKHLDISGQSPPPFLSIKHANILTLLRQRHRV